MDEITEIKQRAGIQEKPRVYYAVVVPTLATNASIDEPSLYTFEAESDEDAIKQYQNQRRDSIGHPRIGGKRMISGNTNWYKVAVLVKVTVHPSWIERDVLAPSSNTIPS